MVNANMAAQSPAFWIMAASVTSAMRTLAMTVRKIMTCEGTLAFNVVEWRRLSTFLKHL